MVDVIRNVVDRAASRLFRYPRLARPIRSALALGVLTAAVISLLNASGASGALVPPSSVENEPRISITPVPEPSSLEHQPPAPVEPSPLTVTPGTGVTQGSEPTPDESEPDLEPDQEPLADYPVLAGRSSVPTSAVDHDHADHPADALSPAAIQALIEDLVVMHTAHAAAHAAEAAADRTPTVSIPPLHVDDELIYLTFDDGPNPVWTPIVLDTLARYGAVATFFVMGGHVAEHPDLIARISEEGHGIENHTYWHVRLDLIDAETFSAEIRRTDDAIRAALGSVSFVTTCLRPPFGAWDEHTGSRAAALGKRLVGWDFSPQDWIYQDPVKIANDTLQHSHPGSVLLFHDTNRGTAEALPMILSELLARGYRFGVLCT